MSAPGTPKASQAAITAVQEALGCERCHHPFELDGVKTWDCINHYDAWTERGCRVAVAAADAAAPHNAAQALRDAADEIQRQGAATTSAESVRTWLRMRAHRIESTQ